MFESSDGVNHLSTLELLKRSERLRQNVNVAPPSLPRTAKKIVTTMSIPLRRHSTTGHPTKNYLCSKDKPTYKRIRKGKFKYFQCNKCPAWESKVEEINEHQLLHLEGSISIPCPDCGWAVLPQQLESHRSRIHLDSTTPDYTVNKRPYDRSRVQFGCKQCPATVTTLQTIKTHLMLHRPDSKAQICKAKNCGWLVDPVKMNWHYGFYHPEERLKCKEYPAKLDSHTNMKKHQQLYKRRKGVDCEKCGWRVRDLCHHNSRWHSVGEGEDENEGGQHQGFTSEMRIDRRMYHTCRFCPFFNRSTESVKSHLRLHKEGEMDVVVCKMCRCYIALKSIKRHVQYYCQKGLI
ncbi:unnamed protein product [Orchesella dallaii]|uniref:C2H2-type domain-containing protein n=1 Tax=Orchesella dallaii TaxID=48710 RepID=A0ABP1RX50_9HEXA